MKKTIIFHLLRFLRKPDDSRLQLTLKEKAGGLAILFFLNFILSLGSIFAMTFAREETGSEFARNRDYHETLVLVFVIFIMPFVEELIFRYFLRYERINPWLINRKKWNAIFPYLVYSSTLAFALVHLTNYSFTFNSDVWYIYPLLVLPQMFTGTILVFLRVRFNFYHSVIYHMVWNLFFLVIVPVLIEALE